MWVPPTPTASSTRCRQALAQVDKVLASDPENRDALLAKINTLRDANRAEEALAIADTVLARDPADAAIQISRAHVLAKLKRFADALAAADTAVGSAPENPEAHLVRGMALCQLGRTDEALKRWIWRTASALPASDCTMRGRSLWAMWAGYDEAARRL